MKAKAVAALCVLLLAGMAPDRVSAAGPTEEEVEEAQLFILGNTIFTLYHELGHALVHLLDLPVLGREEDAVDNLATILMLPEEPDELRDQLVVAAADGWYMSSTLDEEEEPAWWGAHSLDLQRYYGVLCLIYGSDPDGFADLADNADLPEERREACVAEYAQVALSWSKLLSPHAMPDGHAGPSAIGVTFAPPGEDYAHLLELLRESGAAEAIAGDLGTAFRLPRPVEIRFERCEVENAFYDPETARVTFCYELIAFYERLIMEDISNR